jgi:endonuclease-8
MPEGHLLHRAAREQSAVLAGSPVAVSSPQGRLDVAALDGRVLERVEAYGKHLLDRFEGDLAVHVHLGMRGLFLRYDDPAVPPRAGTRLRLAGRAAFDLIAPTTCEVLDPAGVAAVLAKLGPDPLRPDADEHEAVRRLRASRLPLAAALLDQGVWAGIGNAWRAELLYLERLAPGLPCGRLDEDAARALWHRAGLLLALGRDAGQVVSDPDAPDERWVYKRETCRGCGAPVAVEQVGGRTSYRCSVEQTAR